MRTRRASVENTVASERRRSVVTSRGTVADMMTPDPIALPQTASVFDAAPTMREASIGNVIVLDGQRVCGIVTGRDGVVRAVAAGRGPRPTKMADICSPAPTNLKAEGKLGAAVRLVRGDAGGRTPGG